jgi:hypothetical protein
MMQTLKLWRLNGIINGIKKNAKKLINAPSSNVVESVKNKVKVL